MAVSVTHVLSRLCLPLILLVSLGHGFSAKLTHLSTVYLPHSFQDGRSPQFAFQSDAVERAVLEPTGKLIYAVGKDNLHIINATDPKNLSRVTHVSSANQEFTDVAVCGGAVFVTYVDNGDLLQGGVLQYSVYDVPSSSIAFVRDIKIGTHPDMLVATKNCTLVVALGNPAVRVAGRLRDPPGGVGIIRFPQGVSSAPVVKTLNFTAFDSRFDELSRSGVRWVYRQNNAFSDDLQPEYVTLDREDTTAFVGLQNNNAIAKVDLTSDTITTIHGLGFKNWSLSALDPSDRDNGITMAPWPIYGIYQPQGLQWFRWKGEDYVISANEGDSKNYESVGFYEGKRGSDFLDSELSPSVNAETKEALRNDAKLGRLKLSAVDGRNQAGKVEKFFTFGGRSFSIWRASDMAQVYDSRSELSQKTADSRRQLFNAGIKDGDDTVADGMDNESDNKGIEAESVAVAVTQDYLLLFVGLENPGTVAIYSVTNDNDMEPRFESLYIGGIPTGNSTWNDMYNGRQLHAVDPETITYLGPDTGLTDKPLLLVTGACSGTVTLLTVEVSGAAQISVPSLGSLLSGLLLMVLTSH